MDELTDLLDALRPHSKTRCFPARSQMIMDVARTTELPLSRDTGMLKHSSDAV